MPSELALAFATHAKISLDALENDDDEPVVRVADWFTPSSPRSMSRTVPYESIVRHADREYEEWRSVSAHLSHLCDAEERLHAWIRTISVEELASLIDETPAGMAADERTGVSFAFTAWQRISMRWYVEMPFDVTSEIRLSNSEMEVLSARGRKRRIPVGAQYGVLKGCCRDVGIVDLPTATGKTAWSLCVAYMLVGVDARFARLKREHEDKRRGTIVTGPSAVRVARLVLVSASATTHEHFVSTIRRLQPCLEALGAPIELCTVAGSAPSLAAHASDPGSAVVFWVVPASKLTTVLRSCPDVVVPVCVSDEYVLDTPKERSIAALSPVLKHLVLQATPQALVAATSGSRSWLRTFFGGTGLVGPRQIDGLLKGCCWNEAQKAVEQACMLDVMTVTPFRKLVRMDLRPLVPIGLLVIVVPSKRSTFASLLLNTQADVLPASFGNVVLSFIGGAHRIDDETRTRFRRAVEGHILTPKELQDTVDLLPKDLFGVERLRARISEYREACPICLVEPDEASSNMRVFGCCGYCVCRECFVRCRDRCAFCRTTVSNSVPRVAVETEEERRVAASLLTSFPHMPVELATAARAGEISTSVERFCRPHLTQRSNLAMAMHCLAAHGYRRTIVVVEAFDYFVRHSQMESALDLVALAAATGYAVHCVDDLIAGKGTRFAPLKARFDSPDPRPMALVSKSTSRGFLVGTDLTSADSLVSVGDIPTHTLTQISGRLFRPNVLRDNTKSVVFVKVFTNIRA